MRFAPIIGWSAILRVALTAAFAVPLAAHPAQSPLGVIMQAVRGNGGVDIPGTGSTIYAGDRLKTEGNEKLQARLGDSQLFIAPSTLVEVGGLPNDPSITLISGTVVISSLETQTFQLLADGITIRPLGTQGAKVQVTWVNSRELKVASISGELQLSMGDAIRTLMPGDSDRIEIETENAEPQGPPGSGKGAVPADKNHFTKYVIVVTAIATGIGIWRAVVSPCAP
jgi:hypothetical protein